MDRFSTLEPVKLYASAATSTFLGRNAKRTPEAKRFVGRLPEDLYQTVLTYLAIPDVPAFSRSSRWLSQVARDERVWEKKWRMLDGEMRPR